MTKKTRNIITNILFIISVLFIVWLLASFVNVVCHNDVWASHEYASWNLFSILENLKFF